MKTVQFFSEQTNFTIKNKNKIREWLFQIICQNKKSIGEINIIFCSDEYLLKLNEQYLNHNTFTDIITFDFVEDKIISGDIFISVDQMKENAKMFHVKQSIETHRLIAHGVLHLLGYKDKSPKAKKIMTAQEERALEWWFRPT
ncbi:MAG: rRNA maturation RNase YbeY [Bacteroidales bacterium]|jgi:rRNA maturation RNase YbeY|nr:rRNA maturation RNase YbeY [Bacteroidales bacterium]